MNDIYNRLSSDAAYKPIVETNDEIEMIVQQVKMVLGTKPGRVLGSPNFGIDLKQYLFSMSYNQDEIIKHVQEQVLENIRYDNDKYDVMLDVKFGKDSVNAADYALVDVLINQRKYLGVIVNQ